VCVPGCNWTREEVRTFTLWFGATKKEAARVIASTIKLRTGRNDFNLNARPLRVSLAYASFTASERKPQSQNI